MKIRSIQTGKARDITYRGKQMRTGIFKTPVEGPVFAGTLHLEGDETVDLSVHGGKDKALYAYACDAYEAWAQMRPGDAFGPGAMGENFSVDHLPEDKIYIGDTYEIGEAVIQVTQPRFPCQKLAAKFNDPGIIRQFMAFKRPGVYFRVLKEGVVNPAEDMKLIGQEDVRIPVLELFLLKTAVSVDRSRLEEILKLKTLNEQWREDIEVFPG